jgi:hypothetical protein
MHISELAEVDIDLDGVKRLLRQRKLFTVLLPWLAIVVGIGALFWASVMWKGDEFSRLGTFVVSLGFIVFFLRTRWFARFSESIHAAEKIVDESYVALLAIADSVDLTARMINERIPTGTDGSGEITVKKPQLLEALKTKRKEVRSLRADFENKRHGYGWQEVLLAVSVTLVSGYGVQWHQFFNT